MRIFRQAYTDKSGTTRHSAKWYVEFRCHNRIAHRWPAFEDKKRSNALGLKLDRLVEARRNGETPPVDLLEWLMMLAPDFRERMAGIDLIDPKRLTANKPLALHLEGIDPGTGETSAALQFQNAYIIDGERGTENYDKLIAASNSVVFQTTDLNEVIAEVKALLTEKHDYRTLVIDPITPIFNDLLDKSALTVGEDFGRHYGAANKVMKRMANLIMALDMNVIVTAHAKAEYGPNLSKLGYTFDGWKQLDYWFDLVIELSKKSKKRMAKVVKSRIETFPNEDVFEWSYAAVAKRYDAATLERAAGSVEFATHEQLIEVQSLLQNAHLPKGLVQKWWDKASAEGWEDMTSEALGKCINYMRERTGSNGQKELADRF